jgi:hypothetical protein
MLMNLARRWAWLWLPVFLVAKLTNRFLPDSHPWKGRKETLASWRDHGTEIAFGFAVLFWWCGFLLLVCLVQILRR